MVRMKNKFLEFILSIDKYKFWHLLLIYCIAYVFLMYTIQEYIYFDPKYFTGGNNNSSGMYRRVYRIIYFVLPFLVFAKVKVWSLLLQIIGGKSIKENRKLLEKVFLLFSFVMLIPLFFKVVWFMGIKTDYTMEQADAFRFLSLYQLFIKAEFLDKLAYLMKFLSLFQLTFMVLLTLGIQYVLNIPFLKGILFVVSSYLLPVLIVALIQYLVLAPMS
jgi:hypothetical protein